MTDGPTVGWRRLELNAVCVRLLGDSGSLISVAITESGGGGVANPGLDGVEAAAGCWAVVATSWFTITTTVAVPRFVDTAEIDPLSP